MKLHEHLIAVALALGAGHAWANDVPLSNDQIQSDIIGKTIVWKLDDGKNYELQLAPGGKATVSGPYNDVGTWRMNGEGSYCTRWNKQTLAENCVQIVRRDGALTSLRMDGSFRGTVVSVK
ncbi:hypothetical protein QTI66_26315 [Variovorax sp. J22R133]|uniref:hypothetical protein n=1 Tax=Variovorax brevis TaxID=3053503 RepID=UPI002576A014|nr:hypothetical protein [Variovorax sp. J22R133]MDM0115692.1 hypothetical protein [Variovorax sp. J22R133]